MDISLIKRISEEVSSFTSPADIVRIIPQFVAAAQILTVPGVEKRALVLKCLHSLVENLVESGKIAVESKDEISGLINLVGPVAIDAILDVVRGRVIVGFECSAIATADAKATETADAETTETAAAETTATADCKKPNDSVEKVAVKGINCLLAVFKAFYSKKK